MTFEQFAATRLDAIVRFATVLTNDRALAEDVVQEVLIRAHRRWAQIENLDQPEAYVRRMIVNEFYSWRRKWARYLPRPAEELDRPVDDHAASIADRRTLLAEVAKLPRKQRAVLVLRYFDDLSEAETATIMRCSPGTVKSRSSRAIARLRASGLLDAPKEARDG